MAGRAPLPPQLPIRHASCQPRNSRQSRQVNVVTCRRLLRRHYWLAVKRSASSSWSRDVLWYPLKDLMLVETQYFITDEELTHWKTWCWRLREVGGVMGWQRIRGMMASPTNAHDWVTRSWWWTEIWRLFLNAKTDTDRAVSKWTELMEIKFKRWDLTYHMDK